MDTRIDRPLRDGEIVACRWSQRLYIASKDRPYPDHLRQTVRSNSLRFDQQVRSNRHWLRRTGYWAPLRFCRLLAPATLMLLKSPKLLNKLALLKTARRPTTKGLPLPLAKKSRPYPGSLLNVASFIQPPRLVLFLVPRELKTPQRISWPLF